MSLNDFRKKQYPPILDKQNFQKRTQIILIIMTKIIQYIILTLIGCLCWNYLAPLFNLPTLSFLRILALIILSEILFLRGTRK